MFGVMSLSMQMHYIKVEDLKGISLNSRVLMSCFCFDPIKECCLMKPNNYLELYGLSELGN